MGSSISLFVRRFGTGAVALACAVAIFLVMQPETLSAQERQEIKDSFGFARTELPEPTGRTKRVRNVHPSLKRIAAWISATGAAATLSDLDGDGASNDLIHIDPRTDVVSVLPVPGTGERYRRFQLTPGSLRYDAKTMAPMGALVSDVNEDGVLDVVVYYWGRTPIAFLGSKTDAASLAAQSFQPQELVAGKEIWNTSCALVADFDGDGHQDLLFCNYFPDGADVLNPDGTGVIYLQDSISNAFNGGKKHLLRGIGTTSGAPLSASFVDQSDVFPDKINRGWTIAVGATDLTGDLLPEIYFANDTGPDRLLQNTSSKGRLSFSKIEGKSGFTIPTSFVIGKDSFKGMGCDFGDLNKDAAQDIYVSNIACPYGLQESHYLWMSPGKPTGGASLAGYRQASEDLGLSRSGWGWDCRLADFNNDSVMEAVQATGFLKGTINRWPELQSLGTANNINVSDPRNWPRFGVGDDVSGHETNAFFVRARNGRYFNCAEDVALADETVSRGIAVADVDVDGKLDFVVANQWEPSYSFHNTTAKSGTFLGLKLLLPLSDIGHELKVHDGSRPAEETAGSVPAIGAVATLHRADGSVEGATVDGGAGHSGKRAQELHFGLGSASLETTVKVDLRWRTRAGVIKERTVDLRPGWHTIELFAGGVK